MKITKTQLKQIIKEEVMKEARPLRADPRSVPLGTYGDRAAGEMAYDQAFGRQKPQAEEPKTLEAIIGDFLARCRAENFDEITLGQIVQAIRPEMSGMPLKNIEGLLSAYECEELVAASVAEHVELFKKLIKESGGVAGNFGGRSGGLGAVGGRADGPDSPDHDLQGPQQNAEDSLIGLMIELGQMLDVWEKKDYPSDEDRYKSYFSDLQGLLSKYDPCAHHGKKCDEAHPNQTHEECIEVTINDALQEVYSKRQRRWACAQKNKPASKRKKGLSKKEAGEMCKGPMKTKKRGKK